MLERRAFRQRIEPGGIFGLAMRPARQPRRASAEVWHVGPLADDSGSPSGWRPLGIACSPLCNAIEWAINPFLSGQAIAQDFFIAIDCLVCARHRGGTPVETGISPANLTSGRTSVRTIIPNTGKAEFQEGGPILENGACHPWRCVGCQSGCAACWPGCPCRYPALRTEGDS